MSDPIDDLKNLVQHIDDLGESLSIQTRATLAIASRIADLERTVDDHLRDTKPALDRAEIVERYVFKLLLESSMRIPEKYAVRRIINDLIDEVTK